MSRGDDRTPVDGHGAGGEPGSGNLPESGGGVGVDGASGSGLRVDPKWDRSVLVQGRREERSTTTEIETRQVADFLDGYAKNEPVGPTFRDALETQKVCDAVLASATDRSWHSV